MPPPPPCCGIPPPAGLWFGEPPPSFERMCCGGAACGEGASARGGAYPLADVESLLLLERCGLGSPPPECDPPPDGADPPECGALTEDGASLCGELCGA
ncbi:hypothetical protein [Amycolatopsis sp. WGS_07]|uniref:hypothetical protein n=1 Tax=Amycolatopsis sp. WGS_07 TaxID=3076764 RepID=UPI00387321BA